MPVPPGFTITTEACNAYMAGGKEPIPQNVGPPVGADGLTPSGSIDVLSTGDWVFPGYATHPPSWTLTADATPVTPDPQRAELARRVADKFGPMTAFPTLDEYRQLARETGFEVTVVDDVTPGLVPSFKVVRKLLQRAGREEMAWATDMIEAQLRQQVSRYVILAFDATTPASAPPAW